ncbi:MAG: AIR synthase-related protein [Nanoarchaeota archaeon]|nr:AIR synthase-related protein [Nanoarchaeota archaeon]
MGMKYSEIVDYDKLDPFKEECIKRFRTTLVNPNRLGMTIVPESIGETAVAVNLGFGDFYIAFGVEGLGTKNMIAEAMAEKEKIGKGIGLEERLLFSGIGQDEMAMTLNDLSGIGATPILFEPIVATGDGDYLVNNNRSNGLIDGFEKGAQIARVAIPGGETPTLKGIVYPNTIDLAGGSLGIIQPRTRLTVGNRLTDGLTIYGVASSGIQSNGVSLARKISEKPDRGYFTRLPSGRTIGEALLTPCTIYSPFVEALFEKEVDVRYIQPITGHGFAKIMRKKIPLKYVIYNLPVPQEEFRFMQSVGPVDDEEAYRVWNMGVGLVVIAPGSDRIKVGEAGKKCNLSTYVLGYTEKGDREVLITQKDISYKPR